MGKRLLLGKNAIFDARVNLYEVSFVNINVDSLSILIQSKPLASRETTV